MMRALERLARNIKLAIGWGTASAISKGGTRIQTTLLAEETADNVPRLQNYGFASFPESGGAAAVVCVGGYREQAMAIAVEGPDGSPEDLQSGEVKIYTASGDSIHFKANGTLEIYSQREVKVESEDSIKFKASELEVDGDLKIKGDVEMEGDFELDGGLKATDDIETEGDCIADSKIRRASLNGHEHVSVLGPTVPPKIPNQGS